MREHSDARSNFPGVIYGVILKETPVRASEAVTYPNHMGNLLAQARAKKSSNYKNKPTRCSVIGSEGGSERQRSIGR